MLITRDLTSKMEEYFINYPKRAMIIQNNEFQQEKSGRNINKDFNGVKEITTSDNAKMFKVVEKTINYFQRNKEKSSFIDKCIIGKRTWEQAYDDFHIERRTYFAWKSEILFDAVICALLDGLLELILE